MAHFITTTRLTLTLRLIPAVLLLLLNTLTLQAAPIYQSPGSNLTFGDVMHGPGVVSSTVNPAAPAAAKTLPSGLNRGGMIAMGGGVEYGNIDEIFDFIDQSAGPILPNDPDEPGFDPDSPENLPYDPNFGDIILNNPDLEDLLGEVGRRVGFLAGAFAVIKVEGYAKAFLTSDFRVLVSNDIFGGSLVLNGNMSAASKALGIIDPIDFDRDAASESLKAAIGLGPGAPFTKIDLGDHLSLTVDPQAGKFRLQIYNDSLLLTKAAKVLEVSAGYSRLAMSNVHGSLYWGAKAKVYRTGLAQIDSRFGDLTDSEALLDDIKDANFDYDNAFSLDIGVVWIGKSYSLGASVNDLVEPTFKFPAINFGRYDNQGVIRRLYKGTSYRMDRQLRLEAGYFSKNSRWTANMGLDANDIEDPMGDSYQWLTISGGYNMQKWWLPGARIGYRENLSGSRLKYISAGITMFKYIDLDVAMTLKKVTFDGDSRPRGLNVSLGFEMVF